jgi:predicted negative regulator of RcsB-dependent stress response
MDEMMSEQERWDWLKQQVRENYPWVIAGVLLAVGGLSGYRWYQQRVENSLLAAAKVYDEVVTAYDKNDLGTVVKLSGELNRDHAGTGYAEQSTLIAARLQLANNQQAQALDNLQKIMAGSKDAELALVARLRAARVQIDQNKPDEALKTLDTASTGAFAASFAEARGDALYAKGDRAAALRAYQEAQGTAKASETTGVDQELLKLKIGELSL